MTPVFAFLIHIVFLLILIPLLLKLSAIGPLLLLIAGGLAPFESLGWWAGWYDRPAEKVSAAVVRQENPLSRAVRKPVTTWSTCLEMARSRAIFWSQPKSICAMNSRCASLAQQS
jgi:hypothetical protein